jgi:hypothetical protein
MLGCRQGFHFLRRLRQVLGEWLFASSSEDGSSSGSSGGASQGAGGGAAGGGRGGGGGLVPLPEYHSDSVYSLKEAADAENLYGLVDILVR